MATITQNGISFSNVYKDGGIQHGDTIIQDSYKASSPTPSEDNFPLVNAVDIDWNSAALSSAISTLSLPSNDNLSVSSISTSGDLVKAMAEMEKQIQALITLVKALYQSIVS